ncbi:MAG: polysialyltransferase family glycosyltransferase [Candidatus Staskawiczbacteria bacterium]
MKNVFFACGPFTALLCYCIAVAKHSAEDNVLFIVPDFKESLKFADVFRDGKNSPFSNVYCMYGGYGKRSKLHNRFISKQNISFVKKFIESNEIKNIYSSNDVDSEGQALFYFAKKKDKNIRTVCIEDGAAMYGEATRNKKSGIKILLAKIFYGYWWHDVKIYGLSPWTDEIIVTQPTLVRKDVAHKKMTEIAHEDFMKLEENIAFKQFMSDLGTTENLLNQIEILLILPFHDFFVTNKYREKVLEKVFNLVRRSGRKLAVKYHPREPEEDFLSIKKEKDIIILPRAIPLELFYIFSSESVKLVIGDISTALMNARWIFSDKTKVVSVVNVLDYREDNLLEAFKKQGIDLVNDMNFLNNYV